MINKKVEAAMNKQIVAETYSAWMYLSMAAWLDEQNLKGFASWMKVQAQEELTHATLFYNHITDRGGRVQLGAIEAPPNEWKSAGAVFEAAYVHEQKVTAMINNLVELATAEKDFAANPMLQWFVKEQVEEEKNPSELAARLKLVGSTGDGLLRLDAEAGTRTFVYPPPVLAGAAGEGPAA
ncbi:MAG TPA: ferritin [Planctomycetota bacterium]|nr:ferritin [Planctomycetota bacterium]